MKKIVQLLLLVLILISSNMFSQNLLNDYPGIPIITRLPDWDWSQHHIDLIDSMKKAGVDFVTLKVENEDFIPQMNLITSKGIKVIPHKSRGLNYIRYYTDAKYSIWEAEGTPPEVSEAMLSYDTAKCEIVDSGYISFVKTIPDSIEKTFEMIYGPYYDQQVYELNSSGSYDSVDYKAKFNLKLEINPDYPDTTLIENIYAPVCVIQVTQSYVSTEGGIWHLPCTYIVKQDTLTRNEFLVLGTFQEFLFNYNLLCDSCQSPPQSSPPPQHQIYATDNSIEDIDLNGLEKRHYIQFKVVWLGNPRYLLSVDKVVVHDDKGYNLIAGIDTLVAKGHILQQAASLVAYDDSVAGWLGIDEPVSIDNFAPIKRVIEILNNYGNNLKPLWLALMGHWDGVWENRDNIFGTYHLSPWSEMKKRIGNMNIWQDFYYLDYPYRYNYGGSDTACNCTDYRAKNIQIASELNYKRAFGLANNYGISIQCGEIHIPGVAEQRNIWGYELLYETNLALLYGAKYIDLYTYFAMCDTNEINCSNQTPCLGTTRGIIDSYCGTYFYTGKYDTLYYIINPRLKGLLGKTLKTIVPTSQLLNIIAGQFSGTKYISNILASRADIPGENEYIAVYNDLGFFEKGDKEYFMLLNRWYNVHSKFKYTITINHSNGFNNYRITDYVDTTEWFIQNGSYFVDTISKGDARLYSILPVVKYGGNLIADEIISAPTTLTEDMTIESGATLYVNSQYKANANIIVKDGGKIVGGSDGQIVFANGKQLIIEGSVQINGTASNHLKLFYEPTTDVGIKVKPCADLNISYCDIMESVVGISTEPNFQSITIENVNIFDCLGSGIGLIGPVNRHSEATPTIKNCKIMHCGIGISTANISELVIMQDSIMDCNMGIYASHVPAVSIVGNNINNINTPELPGIFMLSSNGNIRGNIIRGHTDGIYLAYSSPNIGGNIIEQNSEHGLFVDVGSIPNLERGLAGPLPLVIAISGYNVVKNNGINGFYPLNTDGSEIFLRDSYIYLGEGCNHVVDDREPYSENIYLMNGYTDEGREIKAEYNYWGTIEPYSQRFGELSVNYVPFNPSPNYSGPCTTPQSMCEEIAIRTSKGELVEMIDVKNCDVEQLTELEQKYAEAQMEYLSGEMDEARTAYQQIAYGQNTTEEKLIAYNKLYAIGNLIDTTNNYFNELQNIFSNLSQSTSDSVLKVVFRQNEILCKVSKEEYVTAINEFENIIQQNPQSEEAVFAEMDILTTALLLDTASGQLGKLGGGKYMVKGSSDYHSKLNEIMKKNFGKGGKEKQSIIPTEYSLSQNYPNPFNPASKIRYAIPLLRGDESLSTSGGGVSVTLKVYDILGREIATLLNEEKPAGYYEVEFNASNLSSGCYFYQIIMKDFVKTMKMLVLK